MSERRLLRQNLQCKPFEWYLTEIWPDNFFPNEKRFFGKIVALPESSTMLKKYIEILQKAEKTQPDWPSTIEFLNSNMDSIKNVLEEQLHCLKQPLQSRGSFNMPYGQARIDYCTDIIDMNEFFVIRDDGHVSQWNDYIFHKEDSESIK